MDKPKFNIPNILTSLNLITGFTAILLAIENEIITASFLVFLSVAFDLSDGITARKLSMASAFGTNFDSISDLVSFGVLPSILFYKTYLYPFEELGMAISIIPVVTAAIRLSRFSTNNIANKTKENYYGMPVPLYAVTSALLIITYYDGISFSGYILVLVSAYIILSSFLMLTEIKFYSFPKLLEELISHKYVFIILGAAAVISLCLTQGEAAFYIFFSIILFAILQHIYKIFFKNKLNG